MPELTATFTLLLLAGCVALLLRVWAAGAAVAHSSGGT